jgi:hypothetical protein
MPAGFSTESEKSGEGGTRTLKIVRSAAFKAAAFADFATSPRQVDDSIVRGVEDVIENCCTPRETKATRLAHSHLTV